MTSQGSPYARFQRVLAGGNTLLVIAAAKEPPRLALADAFAVCIVLRGDARQFPRWATRWHARFVTEVGLVSWHESQLVLTALLGLATDGAASRAVLRRLRTPRAIGARGRAQSLPD